MAESSHRSAEASLTDKQTIVDQVKMELALHKDVSSRREEALLEKQAELERACVNRSDARGGTKSDQDISLEMAMAELMKRSDDGLIGTIREKLKQREHQLLLQHEEVMEKERTYQARESEKREYVMQLLSLLDGMPFLSPLPTTCQRAASHVITTRFGEWEWEPQRTRRRSTRPPRWRSGSRQTSAASPPPWKSPRSRARSSR